MSVQINIENKQHHHGHTQQLVLRLGAWVNAFPGNEYKWMAAQALNACVHLPEGGSPASFHTEITGYLFWQKEIYLVLHTRKKDLPHLLHFFSGVLKMELIAGLNRVISLTGNTAAKRALKRLNTEPVRLYRQHAFTNYRLVEMITGKEVTGPYDTPAFKRLYEMVHGNPFCSAIDYQGGKGPVIVEQKPRLHFELE